MVLGGGENLDRMGKLPEVLVDSPATSGVPSSGIVCSPRIVSAWTIMRTAPVDEARMMRRVIGKTKIHSGSVLVEKVEEAFATL